MFSFKKKIIFLKNKINKKFIGVFRGTSEDLDKKLVYSLSDHKVPNHHQLKYLNKFLSFREFLIIKIAILFIIINVFYLGTVFVKKHLEYIPTNGGTYIEGIVAYPKTVNPIYSPSRDVDNDISRLVYSSLFSYNSNGVLTTDLADNFKIDKKGQEYTIQIKRGVEWHNGEKLTADDVVYTFNIIKDKKYNSPLRRNFEGVKIEKVDNRTVKFILTEPYAPFLELLTFGIIPKNIWENIDSSAILLSELNLKPIGSGPYKFKSLIKNKKGYLKEYHLVVNKDYYKKKPYIDNIVFKFYVSYPEAIKALNDNQINGLAYLPLNQRSNILAKNSLFFHDLEKDQIISIFFNSNKIKALQDKKVRKALSLAIDRKNISNELYFGTYKLVDGPILEDNFAYNNIDGIDYNPEEARNILEEKNIEITLSIVDVNNNVALANQIKYYWDKAGVETKIHIINRDNIDNIIKEHNFEALIYGQTVGGDPDIYSFWHSSQISNGSDIALYDNKQVDDLLIKARTETDKKKRIEEYKQIQEKIVNDYPVVFLFSPSYTYLQSKKIKGFTGKILIKSADRFSNIADWYIKTKKKFVW